MDFVSRFTERIGSRTGREVARKKKKRKKKRKNRGMKKKEDEGGTRERKETVKKTRGKYGYFSIVIHRARISNYDVTGRERTRPGLICAHLCEKFAGRGRGWPVDGGAAPPYSSRGSSDAMIYHRLPVRARRNYSFSETWTDDTFTSSSISNCRTGISCR